MVVHQFRDTLHQDADAATDCNRVEAYEAFLRKHCPHYAPPVAAWISV